MPQGSIVVQVFTSDAEIPQPNAAVSIIGRTAQGTNDLLAFRLTDTNGLTEPFSVETPEVAESRNYEPGNRPFSLVNIIAEQVGYDRILTENVQVFPDVTTKQNFRLIPTPELPDAYDATELFSITEQDL